MQRVYINGCPRIDKYLYGYWVTKEEFAKAFLCSPSQAYKLLSTFADMDMIKRRDKPRKPTKKRPTKGRARHQYLVPKTFSELFKDLWEGTFPPLARMFEGKDPHSST